MKYINLIYPLIYFIIIIIGVVNFEKIRNSKLLKLFLIFLIYSLVTELIAFFVGVIFRKNTFYIYNIWNLANSYFSFYFFYKLINNKLKRNIIKTIALFYTVFSIVDITFFTTFIFDNLNYNIIVSSILIVISVMLYFAELLNNEAVLIINKSIYFWISVGVLFFNIGMIPIFVIAELINYRGIFDIIILSLNIIMAICFITGFIVSKKEFN